MAEVWDLDVTDANNIGRWPENMQFRNVNNAGRADEGILARWFRDTNASLTASGTSRGSAESTPSTSLQMCSSVAPKSAAKIAPE